MKSAVKVPLDTSLNFRIPREQIVLIDAMVSEAKARGEKANRSRIARKVLEQALASA